MPRSPLVLALGAALTLAACASVRQDVGDWFGGTPAPAPTPAGARGQTYFAGEDDLAVYARPSNSSKVVGHLALHARVTRFRVEEGFANVRSADGDLEGWVDNARLIWRLPAAGGEAKPGAAVPAPAADAPDANESVDGMSVEPAPAATSPENAATSAPTVAPTPPPPPVATTTPAATSTPAARPAVFDPF